jgi:hypothetical protein
VNQQPDSFWARIFKTILLFLSFDKVAIECSLENWRVKASNVFVNIQWLLSLIYAGIQSHDILRIPGTISMMGRSSEIDFLPALQSPLLPLNSMSRSLGSALVTFLILWRHGCLS